MKQFYKVRVVVNHKDGSCTVQTKCRRSSPWEFYQHFSTSVHVTAEDAEKYAIDCADRILGQAFFDGKVLQYEKYNGDWCYWEDWIDPYCPNFRDGFNWRIKPDEPKKVKLEAWIDEHGFLMHKASFSGGYAARGSWIRIPVLDYEITLPEGE